MYDATERQKKQKKIFEVELYSLLPKRMVASRRRRYTLRYTQRDALKR